MTNYQEKQDQLVEEFTNNEKEIDALEEVLEQRRNLREQLRGKITLLSELSQESQNKTPEHSPPRTSGTAPVDPGVIEGEAEEVTEDGKGSV